ncbi:hypothetical protein, partial [Pseudoalteromonas mariniglutinosa]|uniref:hypothetical protein n=1 Tax=Pseudoalteromonas mariniglutinosa TaxID=206042 RepID=UPI0039F0FAF3
ERHELLRAQHTPLKQLASLTLLYFNLEKLETRNSKLETRKLFLPFIFLKYYLVAISSLVYFLSCVKLAGLISKSGDMNVSNKSLETYQPVLFGKLAYGL